MNIDDFLDLTLEEYELKVLGFEEYEQQKYKEQFYQTVWLYTHLGATNLDKKGAKKMDEILKSYESSLFEMKQEKKKEFTKEDIDFYKNYAKSISNGK